jgi:hypothetical protein
MRFEKVKSAVSITPHGATNVAPIPKALEHLLEKRATTNRRSKERRNAKSAEKVAVERRSANRRATDRRKKP